jgi:hypothetical protein
MSSDQPVSSKRPSASAKPAQRSEQDRLAAALRDNLKRRKAQARARQGRQDG